MILAGSRYCQINTIIKGSFLVWYVLIVNMNIDAMHRNSEFVMKAKGLTDTTGMSTYHSRERDRC